MQPTDIARLAADLPDQAEYLHLAGNLLEHGSLDFTDPRFGQRVHAYRTPGYPLFLAACGGSVPAARLAQVLLDTCTALGAYLLARRMYILSANGDTPVSERAERAAVLAAVLAAALVAFNPFLIYFSGLLLSETLFTGMLLWGMLLLVPRPGRALHPVGWAGGIVLLCLSVLIRPSMLLVPVVLVVGAVWMNRASGGPYHRRRDVLAIPAAILVLLAVLLPWAYRNHRLLGRWIWTTTNAGITAYDGLNPDADGSSDQSFTERMPELRQMNEVQRSDYLMRRALDYAKQHPLQTAELTALKVARTWSPVPLSDQYRTGRHIVAALAFSIPFAALVVVGLLRRRLAGSAKVFLLLPAIYLTVVHGLSVGSLRYRIPAEPLLAVVAASALLRGPRIARAAGAARVQAQRA